MRPFIYSNNTIFKSLFLCKILPYASKRIKSTECSKSPEISGEKACGETEIATGVASFRKLVEESTKFVDKSLLIKEFVKNKAEVLLVTCPRRWGKSINMSMIKTFLEIEVDKQGNKYKDKTKTANNKLFRGESDSTNLQIKQPLYIAQEVDIMEKYQGEYPVIYVDFKEVEGTSYQEIVEGVKLAINKTFTEHEYLIDVMSNILKNEKASVLQRKKATNSLTKFERLYDNNGQGATNNDIQDSLYFLSEILHNHFGKRAYILMDEYDTPINDILQNNLFSEIELKKTLSLFKKLMGSAFKGNKHLEKGLITGVLRIGQFSLYSGLNNLIEYNCLNNKFAKYYGFTEYEVMSLFNLHNISEEDQEKARDWYDGYRVLVDPNLKLYNPWSIVNFLHHKKIANYWEKSGKIDFISKLFKIDAIKEKILSLLIQGTINNDPIYVKLGDLKFTKDDFKTLNELVNAGDNYKIEPATVDLFFSFLFAAGYLTVAEKQEKGTKTSVKLPNREMKSEFQDKLVSYYEQLYKIDSKLVEDVSNELSKIFIDNDTDKLKKSLEKLFQALPKFVNIKEEIESEGVHGNEDLIHSVINFTILNMMNVHIFGSEVWHKKIKRADIILINEKLKSGMIIEIKYNQSAKEALDQAKQYIEFFENYKHIQAVKFVGINVSSDKIVDIMSVREDNPHYSSK